MGSIDKPAKGSRGRRRLLLGWPIMVAAALLLAVLAAWAGNKLPLSGSPVVKYRLAPVDTGVIVSAISTAGTIRPLAAILVGSQASGQIKELTVDFNARVKRGDVIARLDDDAIQARLARAQIEVDVASAAVNMQRAQIERARADADGARANLAVARADVERAETTLMDAERERDRKRELFARGVSSTTERDRADVAYDNASTQLAAARARETVAVSAEIGSQATTRVAIAQLENTIAQVKQQEAVVRQVRIELEHTVIRAPIDGIVIERNVDIGQTVAASLQAPTLFTIAPDLRAMQVHANVDEADIGRVVLGQQVLFTVDSYSGKTFHGRVVDIRKMPQTTQNVVAYTVVISADNDDLLLLPGMTASARILVQERHNALRLPNAALRFRPAGRSKPSPRTTAEEQPAEQLLRAALDSIDLSIEQRRQIDLIVNRAGCAAGAVANDQVPGNTRNTATQPCQDASRLLTTFLSEDQRERYQAARSLLARDSGTTRAEVWVVGPAGAPEPRQLVLGATDGLVTEIVDGDLSNGDRVIVGAAAEPARPAGLAGL
jgi:HlyD family secretion protein